MGTMTGWAVAVVVAAGLPDPAVLDFRGLPPERVQATLDAAWPKVEACLAPPVERRAGTKWSPPVVPSPLPSVHLVTLVVDPSGAVQHLQVEGPPRLDPACVQRALLPLMFDRHGERATVVKVPLRCGANACAAPWRKGD